MLQDLKKSDLFYFAIMIAVLTPIFISSKSKQFPFNYKFTPDYKIHQLSFWDQIDSVEKLTSILHADFIQKEFTPDIGDLVIYNNGEYSLLEEDTARTLVTIRHSTNSPAMDYSSGYVFSTNVMGVTKKIFDVERIKTEELLESLKKSVYFADISDTINIGDFIWKKGPYNYVIINDDNLCKKHTEENLLDECDAEDVKYIDAGCK